MNDLSAACFLLLAALGEGQPYRRLKDTLAGRPERTPELSARDQLRPGSVIGICYSVRLMSRLVCILVLAFLPFQLSWAVAREYCSHHEEGDAAQHFGHHPDEHAEVVTPTDEPAPTGSPTLPDHCDEHHGAALGIKPPVLHVGTSMPLGGATWGQTHCPSSAPRAPLDRPKWACFAHPAK